MGMTGTHRVYIGERDGCGAPDWKSPFDVVEGNDFEAAALVPPRLYPRDLLRWAVAGPAAQRIFPRGDLEQRVQQRLEHGRIGRPRLAHVDKPYSLLTPCRNLARRFLGEGECCLDRQEKSAK